MNELVWNKRRKEFKGINMKEKEKGFYLRSVKVEDGWLGELEFIGKR